MSKITCYDSSGNVLDHYTQWDLNQKLIIRGADDSSAPQFHFSNSSVNNALIVPSFLKNGEITVSVPNILLQQALPLIIHMYYQSDGISTTRHCIRIPVEPRKKPDNYVYTDTAGGIVLDNTNIIIGDENPQIGSVVWFNTSATIE